MCGGNIICVKIRGSYTFFSFASRRDPALLKRYVKLCDARADRAALDTSNVARKKAQRMRRRFAYYEDKS